jgi:branched-chain amino acid aminotransferase
MSFSESKWVWKNGEFVRWEDATTHVSIHALHYGSGVFEGIRCYETPDGPAVFRLDAHLDRFFTSADFNGLQILYTRDEVTDAICELIQLNEFRSCYVRPLCYFGSGSLSLHPAKCPTELVIMTWPWAPYLGAEGLEHGIRATISPWVKFHSQMMPTTVKACGQYINSILAVRDAVSRGFDEAILRNADGSLAEGSGENLFLVKNGVVYTNDESNSILLGITREAVIQIARDLGYPVCIQSLSLEDLLDCDEAFFTGTAAEVTPIREVDSTLICEGRRGPVTTDIQAAFFAAVSGRDEKYSHWLHAVERETVKI